VSLILDALRRRSADRGGDDSAVGRARADAVPATLGYARPPKRQGVPLRTLFFYGVAAVAIGFVGLTGVIAILSPSAPPTPAPRAVASSVPRP